MTICIFPGTFNPIHSAHLKMAEFALSNFGFEKIIFIPAYIPPHKDVDKNLAKHRFKMVEIATQSNEKFEVSDVEYKSNGKSYTLITVQKIIENYNIKGKLNLIIGTDAFKNIRSWYEVDKLKNLVHFIVFQRGQDKITDEEFSDFDYEITSMEKINMSSTEIRENSQMEKITNIKEYIENNELYA